MMHFQDEMVIYFFSKEFFQKQKVLIKIFILFIYHHILINIYIYLLINMLFYLLVIIFMALISLFMLFINYFQYLIHAIKHVLITQTSINLI